VTDSPAPPAVVDVPDESRFVARGPGAVAELQYHLNGSRLVLIHTEVPDALSGHGLGGRLVRAALDRAEREGLTVVPWCPFARRWLHEHPDEAARVTVDWDTPRPPGR
jgi:predicted GNAT family acetyltransferase